MGLIKIPDFYKVEQGEGKQGQIGILASCGNEDFCGTCEVVCTAGCQSMCESGCCTSGCTSSCTSGCTSSCTSGCTSSCTSTCDVVCMGDMGCEICEGCEVVCTSSGENDPIAPPVPSAPLIDYRTEGGYRVYWGASSGATDYTLRVRRGYDSYIQTFNTVNTYYNVTGLQYGVTYYLAVRAAGPYGSSVYSSENPATTAPKTPTAVASEITDTSVSITVSGMENNFDNINVSGWRGTSSSGTSIGTKTVTKAQYDADNRTVTFTGLTAKQDYYFEIQSNFTVSGTTLWSVNVDTVHAYTSARPDDWTWTAAELSIFNNGGKVEDISYLRWNAFIDRVNDFAVYCGVSQLPGTVKMSSSDRTLYASDFKAVAQKIHDMSGAVASELRNVSSGDDVNGWYFPHLATALSYIE